MLLKRRKGECNMRKIVKAAITSLVLSTALLSGYTASAAENTTKQTTTLPQQLESLDRTSYIDWGSKSPLNNLKITDEKGKKITPKETFLINVVHSITSKDAKTIAKQVKDNEVEKATLMIIKTIIVVTDKNELIATPVASVFYVPDNKNKTMNPINKVFNIEKPTANQDLGKRISELYWNHNKK